MTRRVRGPNELFDVLRDVSCPPGSVCLEPCDEESYDHSGYPVEKGV